MRTQVIGQARQKHGSRVGRRALLAILLAAPALRRATAQGALRRISQSNALRIALDAAMAVGLPGATTVADPFSEALGRALAGRLGVRAHFLQGGIPGNGMAAVLTGDADVAVSPLLSRPGLRVAVFGPPHALVDLVVVAPEGERLRLRPQLRNRSVALLRGQAEALSSRGEDLLAFSTTRMATDMLDLEGLLMRGLCSAAILARHQAAALARRQPALTTRMALGPQSFAAASVLGDEDLANVVDLAMREAITSGEVVALFEQHVGLRWQAPRG